MIKSTEIFCFCFNFDISIQITKLNLEDRNSESTMNYEGNLWYNYNIVL